MNLHWLRSLAAFNNWLVSQVIEYLFLYYFIIIYSTFIFTTLRFLATEIALSQTLKAVLMSKMGSTTWPASLNPRQTDREEVAYIIHACRSMWPSNFLNPCSPPTHLISDHQIHNADVRCTARASLHPYQEFDCCCFRIQLWLYSSLCHWCSHGCPHRNRLVLQ